MSTKNAVIEMIRQLPDETTIPEIMAELFARQKIAESLRELDDGRGAEHEEAKKRLCRWLD